MGILYLSLPIVPLLSFKLLITPISYDLSFYALYIYMHYIYIHIYIYVIDM